MSNSALTWAWLQSLKPAPKLVLLCLADHADKGGYCWPSLMRLAELTGLDRSTVTRNLSTLVDFGLIERDRSAGGQGKSTRYRLMEQMQDAPVKQLQSAPVEQAQSATVADHKNRCDRSQNRCDRSQEQVRYAPRTIRNPQEPPERAQKRRARTLSKDFSLTVEMQAWAREKFPDIDHQKETEKFIDHARANNRKQVDWQAAWRNWIRKADEFSKQRQTKQPPADRTIPAGEYF